MLHWTLVLLIVGVVATLAGFGGVAGAAPSVVHVLFLGFVILGGATFMANRSGGAI
jgi:uncharacterized membrane protein YtjA (UPF0391 family)